jgi:hypothetical protein
VDGSIHWMIQTGSIGVQSSLRCEYDEMTLCSKARTSATFHLPRSDYFQLALDHIEHRAYPVVDEKVITRKHAQSKAPCCMLSPTLQAGATAYIVF